MGARLFVMNQTQIFKMASLFSLLGQIDTHNKVGTQVGQMPLKMPGLSMKPPGIQKGVLSMTPSQLNSARPGVAPAGKSTGTSVKSPVSPISPISPANPSMQNTAGQQG